MSHPRTESVLEAGHQARKRLAGDENAKDGMRGSRARAASPDRAVTIVAGLGGSIIDVQPGPEAKTV